MGSSVSDLLYPDNPNRRRRAEGLRQDIRQFIQDFEKAKALKDEVMNKAKKEFDNVLSKLGVKTRDELDKYIRDNIKNDADLKAYDELKKSIEKWDETSSFIVDIIGLAGIGTLVVGGIAALIGIITFATALGALEIIGGLGAALALVAVILSIYEGAVQRQKLREAIHAMLPKRAEVFQCVQRMKILSTWAQTILNELQKGKSFEDMKDLLQEGLKEPWDACTLEYCQQKLHEKDVRDGAWMNEDGGYYYMAGIQPLDDIGVKLPCVDLSFTPLDTGECQSVKLILRGAFSSTVCIATSDQDTWFLSGKPVDNISQLDDERYDLERVPAGKTGTTEKFSACRLKVNSISFV